MHLQTNKHIAAELAKKIAKQMSNFCLHLYSILFAANSICKGSRKISHQRREKDHCSKSFKVITNFGGKYVASRNASSSKT